MHCDNVTACIFAWNEEKRILRAIRNFSDLMPVLVIDNCSTDHTVAVVEAAGFRTVEVLNPGFIETSEVMEPVFDACETDYIIVASVSEYVPRALLLKYCDVAKTGSHDIVRAFRVSITAGLPLAISGRPTGRHPGDLRFLRRNAVSYKGNRVHQLGTIQVKPERVLSVVTDPELHFYQFRDYDTSYTEQKHRVYNDVLAAQWFSEGKRFSLARMTFWPLRRFLDAYVRFGCWRYGMLGLMHALFRAQMELGLWLRLWEHQTGLTREQVIVRNDAARRQLEVELPIAEVGR